MSEHDTTPLPEVTEPTQFDTPLRWLIPSGSRPVPQLVELDAYQNFGRCSCEHFTYRLQPVFDEHPDALVDVKERCKHIVAAREALLNQVIDKLKSNDGIAS